MTPDLKDLFREISERHFDGLLVAPTLRWNTRLSSSAGRFIPPRNVRLTFFPVEGPIIEIAGYLLKLENGIHHIRDTLAHEMIHYWLWCRRKPYGHTKEFSQKAREMGVNRYNPVPMPKPWKYVYACGHCAKEIQTRRTLKRHACAACCKRYNKGEYHPKYALELKLERNPSK